VPPFSVRPAPGRRRGLFANCQDLVGPAFPIKGSREEERSP